ncbi:MAG: TonB family protein [Bryobacterales bacterium]|nr:TonB family protein [Bryobacteraceae bacterium]MDW8354013.1 TonB family protein [Bryobacterales bacterium]
MATHTNILDTREGLKKPFLASMGLHAAVIAALAFQTLVQRRPVDTWGDPNSLGGSSVGITPVRQIPLPSRGGLPNPLANDTESSVPQAAAPKRETRLQSQLEPDAIPLRGPAESPVRSRPARPATAPAQTQQTPGQLYSDAGRALSSPLVGQVGRGGVGIGGRGAFGTRFGWYRDLLEQIIAQKWRTDQVDPHLRSAPPVIVTFVIHRNGRTSDVRIEQSSGNKALDYSALRAVYDASPFPPLPAGYERDEARIEIWFQLQR